MRWLAFRYMYLLAFVTFFSRSDDLYQPRLWGGNNYRCGETMWFLRSGLFVNLFPIAVFCACAYKNADDVELEKLYNLQVKGKPTRVTYAKRSIFSLLLINGSADNMYCCDFLGFVCNSPFFNILQICPPILSNKQITTNISLKYSCWWSVWRRFRGAFLFIKSIQTVSN